MMPYQILVPMDFSDCSRNALLHALKIAKKMNGKLLLLHAYQLQTFHDEFQGHQVIRQLEEGQQEEVKQLFKQLNEDIPELQEVNHQFIVEHAFAIDAIRGQSLVKEADLIIMGTKGAEGIKAMVLGSNAYATIKNAPCPVLVIPEKATFTYPSNIAFAADYKKIENLFCLNPLLEMARSFVAKIHIFHFSKEPNITREEAEEAKKLGQFFRGVKHRYHFHHGDDFEDDISDYMKENDIHVLAILPRQHRFFERLFKKSWTRMMAFQSDIPLLTIPS